MFLVRYSKEFLNRAKQKFLPINDMIVIDREKYF